LREGGARAPKNNFHMPKHSSALTDSRTPPTLVASEIGRHVLVVGKTGMGKSRLLSQLCRTDADKGNGFLLVDPHGDLAHDVFDGLPRRRRNDLVRFDASEPQDCPGLNPLRSVPPQARSLVVSNALATMRKLWPDFWGPRTEHVLRHALLALTEVRGATLDDARAMLVDGVRRDWVLKQVRDPRVRDFWLREFSGYGKQLTAEVTAPILNKLGGLLSTDAAWNVLTKRKPVLDARRAMDRGRLVIASLPKGRIGEDAALFLGGLLIGAFQHAALGRADVPISERRPYVFYVDEAGSFATGPFLELVAEARKYAVGLVLATQSLAILEPSVRAALLGNVGTLVAFRLGADDAEIVCREFMGEYQANHLMRLGIGDMVVRVGVKRPVFMGAEP